MADQRSGIDVFGWRPMKRVLSLFGALAVFAAVLVAGGSGQRVSVASAAGEGCPNSAFRNGPSAALPDCRAYEMVSPVDKEGGDIVTAGNTISYKTSLMQAAPDGSRLTYSSFKAFGDALSALYSNQYIATLGSGGWSTHSINPPRQHSLFNESVGAPMNFYDTDIAVKAFSEDLSTAVVADDSLPTLSPDAIENMPNLYGRDNESDTWNWITGLGDPFALGPEFRGAGFEPEIDVVSANGDHILFVTSLALTPEAHPSSDHFIQLYDYSSGEVHLVSILPNGTANVPAAAGSLIGASGTGEQSNVENALSHDGTRITWSTTTDQKGNTVTSPHVIYQRVNNTETKRVSQLTSHLEVQEVAVDAEGGTYKLFSSSPAALEPNVTPPIPANASALQVQEALEATSGNLYSPGDVLVTGPTGGPYTVTFSGWYVDRNVRTLVADGAELTGPGATVTVSIVQQGTGSSIYDGASTDGREVVYTQSEGVGDGIKEVSNLYRVNVDTEAATLIASLGVGGGFVAASDDLTSIYFVSSQVLDTGATVDKPNLYLSKNGTVTFIGTVSPSDLGSGGGVINQEGKEAVGGGSLYPTEPVAHAVRVTADGNTLAFQSSASLTGYDNRDVKNSEPDVEVYIYDSPSDELFCVSCNPSGRPNGQPLHRYDQVGENALFRPGGGEAGPLQRRWTAAWLTTLESHTYYPRDLSSDGKRLFFNAFDGIVTGDNNNQQDVYEWEAQGTGSCTEAGGCVSLISSGESPKKSEFVDASSNGDVAFFTTGSSLVPQDPGLIDIYAARVGGGFTPEPPPASPCEGDACQPLPIAPNDPTPASAVYNGPEDVKKIVKKKHKRKHRKHKKHGKKKGKGRPHSARASAPTHGRS